MNESDWLNLRRQMPHTSEWTYLDHAAVCPLPGPSAARIHAWTDSVATGGLADWDQWQQHIESARNRASKLIGAGTDEIGLVANTTTGINLVAWGWRWQPGDNVVTTGSEFPSNLYAWQSLQELEVECRTVSTDQERLDPEHLRAVCDERTRIISVSWVGYATGWRNDLNAISRIAEETGAALFVDAIQGLGVLNLDVATTRIDFLAADGHKWLLGPEGAGILYVRRPMLDRLRPLGVGWNSVVQAGRFDDTTLELKPAASRFEGGTYNVAGFVGLDASLGVLEPFSGQEREQRLLDVTDRILERLDALGCPVAGSRESSQRSGIIAFECPGVSPPRVRKHCRENGVLVNCRAGRVRISPHLYTTQDDIERLDGVLRKLV